MTNALRALRHTFLFIEDRGRRMAIPKRWRRVSGVNHYAHHWKAKRGKR